MSARFPGYDVLSKRHSPSWNEKTRQVIDARLALPREPRFLSPGEFRILDAICGRIVPQPGNRPPVPLAAMVRRTEPRSTGAVTYFTALPLRALQNHRPPAIAATTSSPPAARIQSRRFFMPHV